MEKRQLNLNAPLISARRFSSSFNSSEVGEGEVIQIYRSKQFGRSSERKSETVPNPASVPFHWEQCPGTPKAEFKSAVRSTQVDATRHHHSVEAPRLPPARIPRFSSGKKVDDHYISRPLVEAFSFGDHAILLEKLTESLNCDQGTGSENGQDTYSDALDVLSSMESGAVCNTVSRVSGDHSSFLKPPLPLSVHTQASSLMMKRFLEAAKAGILETPKTDVKKPLELGETSKPEKKEVLDASFDNQHSDDVDSEDNDHETAEQKPWRSACGILPRFCAKNTLCLFNPLPGPKPKKRTSHSPKLMVIEDQEKQTADHLTRVAALPVPQPQDPLGTTDPDHFTNPNHSFKSGLSQLRRYRSGSLSPRIKGSPKSSPFPTEFQNVKANKISSSRKLFNMLQDTPMDHLNGRESALSREAVEKTVYIDKSSFKRKGHAHHSSQNMDIAHGCRRFDFDHHLDDNLSLKGVSRTLKSMKQLSMESNEDRKPFPSSRKAMMRTPLPPVLPSSPSDSWLCKTLPSTPEGSPFVPPHLRSGHHSQQLPKVASLDSSWEAIVKTSVSRHQQRAYSQELIHRQSKS